MKKINSLLTSLLLTASLFLTLQAIAQAPQKMSYQSVIRNSSNALLVNTAVGIKISVLQGSASGNAVYTETQTPTTNANGLVSIQIGTGTVTTGTFAGINWAVGPYFIKTETDPAGGTNYTITGTQEMLSVPYAMHVAKSANDGSQTAAIKAMQEQINALQAQLASLLIPMVTIVGQVWTSTNLNVTTYRNGDTIPEVQDGVTWASLTTGAWCHLNNDIANDAIYGKMYNHYAVEDPRGLAPVGYRIPTLAEWFVLRDYVGDNSAKLRSESFTGTNDYGFSVLRGGSRRGNEELQGEKPTIPAGIFVTDGTAFWCSDVLPDYNGVGMGDFTSINSFSYPNNYGFYIRLIKN